MTKLHVFKGDVDWVVAKNHEDATLVWNNMTGDNLMDYMDEHGSEGYWNQLDDNKELSIIFENDLDLRDFRIPVVSFMRYYNSPGHGLVCITAKCSDWAEARGREFLASTEY